MKPSWATFGLLATASAVQFKRTPSRMLRRDEVTDPKHNETDLVVNHHYIVEFSGETDAAAAADALAKDAGIDVLKVFDNDVFRGCAIKAVEDTLDSIQDKPIVSSAWQSRKLFLGEPHAQRFGGELNLGNYSNHHMTGVDKLHAAGVKGKGAKVGVIDTGINYGHKALGGGIGEGFKVVGGYDFVGNGVWPMPGEIKVPDEDPNDQAGHGTHVAGIVAGESEFFTGVAPEASLYAYKVFTTIDGTDEETIIEAMLRAYQDGVDVITISIGGVNGWSDGPWALVASRMVEQGVVVVVSAGNDGGPGAFAASSGSSGANVLSVASVEPDVIAVSTFKATSSLPGQAASESWIPYASVFEWYPAVVKDWPVWALSFDALDDEACEPLPEDTPDLSGQVVLVRRGGCTFEQKQINLEAYNASHVVFYSNDQPLTAPSTRFAPPVLAMIPAEDGKAIIDTLKAGGEVTFDFDYRPDLHTVAQQNFDGAGLASAFTSVGPTNDLFIKSDISAPGGRILSTYLGDGYASMGGTSMAAPYIAGVAALYVGQFGGRASQPKGWAKDLAMRILSSGEPFAWDDGLLMGNVYDALAPVAQVGTGLVNATKVLGHKTTLSFAKFALNDTNHFSRYHKVDITNGGDKPVTYTFSQQDYGGLATVITDPDVWGTPRMAWADEMLTVPQKFGPGISFPRAGFTVQPGQTRTAQFNFAPPANGPSPDTLPVYSGRVVITGSNGDEMSVPYLGLGADLKRNVPRMIDPIIGYPTMTSGVGDIDINDKANFTFNLGLDSQDFPRMICRNFYATRELRWDIFASSWNERQWSYPPRVGEAGFVGTVAAWSLAGQKFQFDPAVDSAEDVFPLPLTSVPRSLSGRRGPDLWWLGGLGNGTQIAPGRYHMRLAALKPFGNPKAADNWDVFETPEIEVLPLEK
ncbi:serine endopeptidase [Plectosphaerella cucumerina]|uniref:Serine endopeptidase n=1 Tax=Plectosphaerella cucumerina TaxID=40658 RepID=A0A8K0TMW5_9PEZI|nr:serine endopeptidase [Plectosphaerella cucumerina]